MSSLLQELKDGGTVNGVKDISVSLTTLEEVFLNLSKAELESEDEDILNETKTDLISRTNIDMNNGGSNGSTGSRVKRSISFWSQSYALAEKNMEISEKQSSQICCLFIFPIFSICLLLLLDYWVSTAEANNMYDMACVNNKTLENILVQSNTLAENPVHSFH